MRGRGKGLESCHARCDDALQRLDLFMEGADEDAVRWFESQGQGFRLNRTPLEIAAPFQNQMQKHSAAWVFTSATLAVGDSFQHFSSRLGVEARCCRWDSPFDYARQTLFMVPRHMPEPRDPSYTEAVARLSGELIAASRGRAFVLFTSHRALQEAADFLRETVEYPVLVQGTAPRGELLDRFRSLGNAVLMGTSSFWEGVDVRGSALSCVIIDKLPFASPGEPVLKARVDAIRRKGGNPFIELQVPQAVIALKQGAGRLIRDVTDRGVLVVCDPRLISKPYGRIFLESLPPMLRTRDLEHVRRFFDQEDQCEVPDTG
jgi:ATP-dependent DNA helicase DinG